MAGSQEAKYLLCVHNWSAFLPPQQPMDSIFPVAKLITHKSILTSDPTQYDVGFLLSFYVPLPPTLLNKEPGTTE